jgi:hypothetical protein
MAFSDRNLGCFGGVALFINKKTLKTQVYNFTKVDYTQKALWGSG